MNQVIKRHAPPNYRVSAPDRIVECDTPAEVWEALAPYDIAKCEVYSPAGLDVEEFKLLA